MTFPITYLFFAVGLVLPQASGSGISLRKFFSRGITNSPLSLNYLSQDYNQLGLYLLKKSIFNRRDNFTRMLTTSLPPTPESYDKLEKAETCISWQSVAARRKDEILSKIPRDYMISQDLLQPRTGNI